MSGPLNHQPAEIVRKLAIAFGLGTLPEDGGNWPIFYNVLPDKPNNLILIRGTEGIKQGRIQYSGEIQERHGLQFLFRANAPGDAYVKARAFLNWMDTVVYRDNVTLDESIYMIQSISRSGDVLPAGMEVQATRRFVYTINATVSLRLVDTLGTGT